MRNLNFDAFDIDYMPTPWERAAEQLRPGDTISAQRFLTLMEMSQDQSSEDAALELEERGIMLDISDLPKFSGNPDTDARIELERKLFSQGGWADTLEKKDPLRIFLREMEQTQELTDGAELAARGAAGDRSAMQELTDGYLRTVYACAGEFLGRGVLLLDLIQEGSLGLWQGILNYTEGPFRDHALWWIRQAMARAVTLQAQASGVGSHLAKEVEAFHRADRKLLTELGRNPTMAELAQEMQIDLEQANALAKMLREIQDMAKIRNLEEKGPEAASEEEDLAVEDTAYFQTRERVSDLMSGLTETESRLLELRYGLGGKPPLTVAEAASVLHMTGEEILAAETAALAKMRRESAE